MIFRLPFTCLFALLPSCPFYCHYQDDPIRRARGNFQKLHSVNTKKRPRSQFLEVILLRIAGLHLYQSLLGERMRLSLQVHWRFTFMNSFMRSQATDLFADPLCDNVSVPFGGGDGSKFPSFLHPIQWAYSFDNLFLLFICQGFSTYIEIFKLPSFNFKFSR